MNNAAPFPVSDRPSSRGKARLLLVEDNPDLLYIFRRFLAADYEVACAQGVEEALAQAGTQPFDLFLLDIRLGEHRTGFDLLRLLRQRAELAHIPALAMTAYAMPGVLERLREADFEGYILKPFLQEGLLEALEAMLARRPSEVNQEAIASKSFAGRGSPPSVARSVLP